MDTAQQTYWDRQQQVFDRIEQNGMQAYAAEIPNLSDAFILQDRILRCMDEGTPGGIHAAGSGILMSKEEAMAFAERAHVGGITTHSGCGACGLYSKNAHAHEEDPDACGPEWAQAFSEFIQAPYTGNISADQMTRPAEFHIARIAYYDATGCFDFSRVPELPCGFVISRAYEEPEYAVKEMNIAISIALGHHGLGDLFTSDHPFRLIAIAKKEDQVEMLKTELAPLADPWNGRVIVEGLLV